MTQDEIMEMARKAGDLVIDARGRMDFSFDEYGLVAFAKLVAAKEREACAKVCDELPAPNVYSDSDKGMWDITSLACGDAIRARGEA